MFDTLITLAAAGVTPDEANPITLLFGRFGIDAHLILAQIVNFGVVAFLLWKFAFGPVMATIDDRQKRIQDGLQYAEEMKTRLADTEKQSAEKLREASDEAAAIIRDARDNAKQFLEKQTGEATAKAEEITRKAQEAMALEHKQMLADIRKEVAGLVVQTSARVLDRELSPDEKSRFNESASKELYSRN